MQKEINIEYVEDKCEKINNIANAISMIAAIIAGYICNNEDYIGISFAISFVIAFVCSTAADIITKEYRGGLGIALGVYGMLVQLGVLCCLLLVAMLIAPFSI